MMHSAMNIATCFALTNQSATILVEREVDGIGFGKPIKRPVLVSFVVCVI